MKVLLLKEAGAAAEKLIFAVESRYGVTVDHRKSVDDALKSLREKSAQNESCDLLISDLNGLKTSDLNTLCAQMPGVQVILCQGEKDSNSADPGWNVVATVNRAQLITGVLDGMEKVCPSAATSALESDTQFCRIRTRLLLGVCPLKGDIYIRLSADKFIKLFREGDVFDQADMLRYTEQKKIEYLYIKFGQCAQFIEKYREDLEKRLAPGRSVSIAEAASIQNSVHETAQEMGRRIGFTKDVQVLAKTQIRIAVKALKSSNDLRSLIESIERNPASYLASHSTLTGFIGSAIASQLDWGSDATMYKLNLAAFLHDITLGDQDIARCEDLEEANRGPYSAEEKELFEVHPMKAAEIAKEFTEVPPDVDSIIMQHHEFPDGSGFPRGLGHAHISPLSAIFIVAHTIAKEVLSSKEPFSMERFVADHRKEFLSGNFRKVMEAVKQLRLDPAQSTSDAG